MKSLIVSVSLSLLSQAAFAGAIPVELKNLVPVGKDEMTFRGKTLDGKECSFDVFSAKQRFSASITAYDSHGNPVSSVNFRLGGNYELTKQEIVGSTVNYGTLIPKLEPDRDLRITLKLHKDEKKLKAVQLLNEEESYIGFNTVSKETCYLR
jgi:hypothetical protein